MQNYKHKHVKDVTVYYKEDMHVTTTKNDDITSANIIIQIHKNKQKNNPIHTIINIYRRPHSCTHTEFTTDLQTVIDTIREKSPKTHITIQGDINIDLNKLAPGGNFFHFLLENDLHTTITTPTRYNAFHNTSTIIDVILTRNTETEITSGTIAPPISAAAPSFRRFAPKTGRDD